MREGEESDRALEGTIYSVVESDRGPNGFILNLDSLALFHLDGDRTGLGCRDGDPALPFAGASVSDPDSFFTDPDPGFFSQFGSGSGSR